MAEKNRFYPNYPSAPYQSANYPKQMLRNNQIMTMTNNNKRAIIPRGQEDNNNQDLVTSEQHQQCMNREITDLENGRGGGQA